MSDELSSELRVFTGVSLASNVNYTSHHLFPKTREFAARFARAGIDVHNPRFMAWWVLPDHQNKASAYNKAWRTFFRENPKASRRQILEQGKKLAKRYNLETHF